MFGNNNEDKKRIAFLEEECHKLNVKMSSMDKEFEFKARETEQANSFAIKNLEQEHRNEIQGMEFALETFKDTELLKRNDEINSLKQKVAVLEEKNKMLDRIIDLDADIIDVKDLVTSLIKKLPEINLKDLTINTHSK